jgi:hypothetical protein
LIFLAAMGLGHRRAIRTLGVLHLFGAAVIAFGLAAFVLDTLQLRGSLGLDVRASIEAAALRTGAIVLLLVGFSIWAGVTSLRVAPRAPDREGPDGPPLWGDKTGGSSA